MKLGSLRVYKKFNNNNNNNNNVENLSRVKKLTNNNNDSNDDNNKRKLSKIEEKIRRRKLKNVGVVVVNDDNKNSNKIIMKKLKSSECLIGMKMKDEKKEGYDKSAFINKLEFNKSISSLSSSSFDSRDDNYCKIINSKELVDLIEIQPYDNCCNKNINDKYPPKINGEILNSLKNGDSIDDQIRRPESAPCASAPILINEINKNIDNDDYYIDYKIVEKNCIGDDDNEMNNFCQNDDDDDYVDMKPIGNPALISVLTESLDKMKKNFQRQEIGEKICDIEIMKSSNFENSVSPCEPDIDSSSPSSSSLNQLRTKNRNEYSIEKPQPCSAGSFVNDEKLNFEKCQVSNAEKNMDKKSIDFDEENFIRTKIIDSRRKSKFYDYNNNDNNHLFEQCSKINNHDDNYSSTSSRDDLPVYRQICGTNCYARRLNYRNSNFTESNFITSHHHHNHNHHRVTDAAKIGYADEDYSYSEGIIKTYEMNGNNNNNENNNNNNNDNIRLIRDRKCWRCRCCGRCCNGSNKSKCCNKIISGNCGNKSKYTHRKVSFYLPSLIPEELESNSCSSGAKEEMEKEEEAKRFDDDAGNNLGILESSDYIEKDKSGENGCSNSGVIFENGSKRGEEISGSNILVKNCRMNFSKEIMSEDRDTLVCGDNFQGFEKSRINYDSDYKNSVLITSDAEWEDECFNNNINCENVSFPKETRRAMNVLIQSRDNQNSVMREKKKENSPGSNHRDAAGEKICNRIKSRKADFKMFHSPGQEATHVASYAEALAVFQKISEDNYPLQEKYDRCDIQSERKISSRGSTPLEKKRKDSEGERNINNFHPIRRKKRRKLITSNNIGENSIEEQLVQTLDQSVLKKRTLNVPEILSKGFKMQTNGSDNGSSENGVDRTGWTVGLINGRFKYLTAETFGFKINANGASLKKKQLWTLEGSEHQVFLRSHLDRYLAVDQFGNVTCEAEDTADPGCAFQIQVASDGSGRWALKNIQRGYFLGSSQDELKCTAKVPADAEYWLVHLAARPQVNLRSAGRKRFAHLSAAQDEIHVDAPVPWGEDTLFTLEFRPAAMPDNVEGNGDARRDVRSEAGIGGHYALHTCNNKYLARDGKLLDSCTRDCLYAAEFHAGMLALRDVSGAYLAPIGSKAVLKSRSNTVTRDELFSLEDSLPQASFVAALNQRYVSVKQGVDVTANQDEISGHETFQLEFDRATKRWYLRTMQDRYWTLEAGGGIQASDHKRSSNALFDLVWQQSDGTVALRANNGKFLATKRSGHLYANADSPGDSEASKFYFYLMNRPVLVLRCEQGFVGLKSNSSPKLECNKASYETIRVERCDRGIVRFKGQNGKYWHADSEGVTSDADVPSDGFYLELREPSRICIKSTDGRYLSAGKNGVFRLGDTDYESATKWEF